MSSYNKPVLEQAKTELQRQLLSSQSKTIKDDTGPPVLLLALLFVMLGFGTLGLYSMLGNPGLSKPGALQKTVAPARNSAAEPETLEGLIDQLEAKLESGQGGAEGWMLYARSLMSLERYSEAVAAYEKVLSLTNNNANVAEEFSNAKAFIAAQSTAQQPDQARRKSETPLK